MFVAWYRNGTTSLAEMVAYAGQLLYNFAHLKRKPGEQMQKG